MSNVVNCLKCYDSGMNAITLTPCDCEAGIKTHKPFKEEIDIIPEEYKIEKFMTHLLPKGLSESYKRSLEGLYKGTSKLSANTLICSPPNSGKTLVAYKLIQQYGSTTPILSLIDVRNALTDFKVNDTYDKLNKEYFVVIRIPSNVPAKFDNIMCDVIDLRVGKKTLFTFQGSYKQLESLVKYSTLKHLREGSFKGLEVIDYVQERKNSK